MVDFRIVVDFESWLTLELLLTFGLWFSFELLLTFELWVGGQTNKQTDKHKATSIP